MAPMAFIHVRRTVAAGRIMPLLLLSLAVISCDAAAFTAGCCRARAPAVAMSANVVTPAGSSMPGRRHPGGERIKVFVDGNNLMMQRKVTKGREQLAARLSGIKGRDVVLVFDGRAGEEFQQTGSDPQVVVTNGGAEDGSGKLSADDWIVDQLSTLQKGERVEIVTADKYLRKQAQQVSAKLINPVRWYRRYLPRLKGLKSDYSNAPLSEADE